MRERTIGASYGDAFLAAVAIGRAPDAIGTWNPVARTVEPRRVPAYARQYPLWKELYADARLAHALGAGMMSATGLAELAASHGRPAALDPVVRPSPGLERIMLYGCGREGPDDAGLAMRLHHGLEVASSAT